MRSPASSVTLAPIVAFRGAEKTRLFEACGLVEGQGVPK